LNSNGTKERPAQAQGLQSLGLMCVMMWFTCTTATAQNLQPSPPHFVQPMAPWGGELVPESVPHQPSILFTQPSDERSPLRLAGLTTDSVPPGTEITEPIDPVPLPGARSGIFQKMFFTGTWLPQLESDSLGWGDFETGLVFGFPFLRRDTPLLITPRFGVHLLDGPTTPDLPAQVYDSAIEFRHLRRFGDGPWAMDAALTLGYYSDFEKGDSDAFRPTGRVLAVYESSPGIQWIFGVAYLNRAGANVLPVGGVIIENSPNMKWELIVPRPRIAWRMPGAHDEHWFYLAGEFGGGVWSITRPVSQTTDLLTYTDFRVLMGYESKTFGGWTRRYEVGYVFGRDLQFDSATPDVTLDDTLFIRAGLTF